jgi:hypothetical protein
MEISTIASIAAAIGVLVGAAIAVIQLYNLRRQRMVNMIISLVPSFKPDGGERFNHNARLLMRSEYIDYHDFVQRYGDVDGSDSEVVNAFVIISGWYESLGLLYFYKLVDRKIFADLFGDQPIMDWEKMLPIIVGLRELSSSEKPYEYFEFMVEDIRLRLKNGSTINKK